MEQKLVDERKQWTKLLGEVFPGPGFPVEELGEEIQHPTAFFLQEGRHVDQVVWINSFLLLEWYLGRRVCLFGSHTGCIFG